MTLWSAPGAELAMPLSCTREKCGDIGVADGRDRTPRNGPPLGPSPNNRISDDITRDHKGHFARKVEGLSFALQRPDWRKA
jgi:hypothetical protein